jgi:hypothetical protein
MVLASVAAISFTILFLLSLPSCLRLRATSFSTEGVGAGAPPRIRPTPVPTPTQAMAIARPRRRFTVCMYHRFRLPGLRPILLPEPTAPAHGRSREPADALRREYGASRSCSRPFFMPAAVEDTVVTATLRLSWR